MNRLKPPNSQLRRKFTPKLENIEAKFHPVYDSNRIYGQSDKVKTSLLIHCIGEKAREVYNAFVFSFTEDSRKYNKVLEHFEAYFGPWKNISYSHFKFFKYRQEPSQIFDNYLTEMRKLSSDCDLFELCESLLK